MSQDQNKEQNMRRVALTRWLAPASSGMTFSLRNRSCGHFSERFPSGFTADGAAYYFL